jgi:sugar O-acyltransferase (sialic acid O-acetyltransferase NeuD family)
MTKKLVIFGMGDMGQLAAYLFPLHTDYVVAGFCVDKEYAKNDAFMGLPVVTSECVADVFPPSTHDMFVAIGYHNLNTARREKYHAMKAAGYNLATYVSPQATTFDNVEIGDNCFIFENNVLQPFVKIGSNTVLWSGNHVGHHSVIGDHCFIASHAVISGHVRIGDACFVGVNATLRDHIVVGEQCIIGAGALLLADAAPQGVYMGEATQRSAVPSTRLKTL